jgi:hypothetical protein
MLITNPQEPHMALDDGGAMPAHPGDPPALPTSTEDADIAAWHRAMDYYRARLDAYRVSLEPQRIAAAERQAVAQEQTADMMGASVAAYRALAEAQQAQATALGTYPQMPQRTRRELVWEAVLKHPPVTGATDLNIVDYCTKLVDAYINRHPGAV